MRRQENLLQQILRLVRAHQPIGQAEQPGRVQAVQLFERARRIPAAALRQRQIGMPRVTPGR